MQTDPVQELAKLEGWAKALAEELHGIKLALIVPPDDPAEISQLLADTADKQLQLSIVQTRIAKLRNALNQGGPAPMA